MRDNAWLHQLLDDTWDKYFSDVPQDNIVRVEFGRRAKNRLGSIKLDAIDPQVTIITMNGLFKNPAIPEPIVLATLVHELSHYAHGFHSPLQKKFVQPHSGGVMRREFAQRGLEKLYLDQKKWLKDNWRGIIESEFGVSARHRRLPKRSIVVPKPFWFR